MRDLLSRCAWRALFVDVLVLRDWEVEVLCGVENLLNLLLVFYCVRLLELLFAKLEVQILVHAVFDFLVELLLLHLGYCLLEIEPRFIHIPIRPAFAFVCLLRCFALIRVRIINYSV